MRRQAEQRDEARGVVDRQSASIAALAAESARQAAIGARNRQLAEAAIAERDTWIARAAAAETRTERLSAEAEAAECERVADALYQSSRDYQVLCDLVHESLPACEQAITELRRRLDGNVHYAVLAKLDEAYALAEAGAGITGESR